MSRFGYLQQDHLLFDSALGVQLVVPSYGESIIRSGIRVRFSPLRQPFHNVLVCRHPERIGPFLVVSLNGSGVPHAVHHTTVVFEPKRRMSNRIVDCRRDRDRHHG